jgi:hypothetical protein
MNANGLVKHYEKLEAEERFALIETAIARNDDTETDRLCSSAPRVVLTFGHHYAHTAAFRELALVVFLELLDLAGDYVHTMHRAWDREADEHEWRVHLRGKKKADTVSCEPPLFAQILEVAYAFGFRLKTKAAGWMLWCKRRNLPPLKLWSVSPGYRRFQDALEMTESDPSNPTFPKGKAFTAEEMLAWLNRVAARIGEPGIMEIPLTAEGAATTLEEMFLGHVARHNGD